MGYARKVRLQRRLKRRLQRSIQPFDRIPGNDLQRFDSWRSRLYCRPELWATVKVFLWIMHMG